MGRTRTTLSLSEKFKFILGKVIGRKTRIVILESLLNRDSSTYMYFIEVCYFPFTVQAICNITSTNLHEFV